MLRGNAQEYYYNLVHTSPNIEFLTLCQSFRDHFEGEELRRNVLDEWNSLTLQLTKNSNLEKPFSTFFDVMLQRLRALQHGLRQELRNDYFLHNKIITACKSVEACSYACFKPSESVTGLINDIRSSISTWKSCHPTLNSNSLSDVNFVDRKFRYQPNSYHPHVKNSFRASRQNESHIKNKKRCIVCRKQGCWSSNHRKEELNEAKRQYFDKMGRPTNFTQRFQQFIKEYEIHPTAVDLDDNETFKEQLENLILEPVPDTLETQSESDNTSASIFFTSIGSINGNIIVQHLANKSFTHALTTHKYIIDNPSMSSKFLQERYNSKEFFGIMIDTGAAAQSTAGYGQFLPYQKLSAVTLNTKTTSEVTVKFGIGSPTSIGSVNIKMPIGTVKFNILHTDTPFLLSINDLDNLEVYFNNITNHLITSSNFRYPTIRRFGHPFLLWKISAQSIIQESLLAPESFLTEIELRCLHRRFGHPSVNSLKSILERSGHDDINRAKLEQLTKFCHHCQKHGKSPGRFRFNIKDEINFNYTIVIDIMYIEGKEMLHVIDEATRFQAAKWLDNVTSKHVWDALRQCWIDTYVGPPDYILHDAGKTFVSREFVQNASAISTSTKSVPTKAHWSIGLVERYDYILHRTYQIICEELKDFNISKEMRLQMAVKAVNDSAGPNGLIPTLLVFGTYPRMTQMDPPLCL
ncbi:hypothetical protein EV44_g3486 [Erysiphe necator]|uniref:Integrase catalytic domain-containing protein n=1 Tax=Uncinula necator TaxID=52586 RepID=A0A0B1P6N3_UNCNE|nr:hypothetical protein EV44_g3486 [Erysiphe necator]